jgi:hypothetical protein
VNKRQRRSLVSGILFIALGVVFLLEALEVFELAPATLWPLLLVAIGIVVLAGTGKDDEDHPAAG